MYDLLESVLWKVSFEFLIFWIFGPVQLRADQFEQSQKKLLSILLAIPRKSAFFTGDSIFDIAGSFSSARRRPDQLDQLSIGNGNSTARSHFFVVLVVQEILVKFRQIEHALQNRVPRWIHRYMKQVLPILFKPTSPRVFGLVCLKISYVYLRDWRSGIYFYSGKLFR